MKNLSDKYTPKSSTVLYVDLFPFRKINDRIEYLLLKRKSEFELGNTWQHISGKIKPNEEIKDSFWRHAQKRTGCEPLSVFKLDIVNTFYDQYYDTVLHVPVAACEIKYEDTITLSELHDDYTWLSLSECKEKLIWPNQIKCLDLLEISLTQNFITKFHYLEKP